MRTLGVEYGEKRIGFAVSDPVGILATPLRVVTVSGPSDALAAVRETAEEVAAERIVIGLPLNMDGTRGAKVEEVEAFVVRLKAIVSQPVLFWDERLSTSMVERVLIDADMSRKRRKEVRDKLAAQVILQGFLDAQS
jgi:putative Holliday junction resolvase